MRNRSTSGKRDNTPPAIMKFQSVPKLDWKVAIPTVSTRAPLPFVAIRGQRQRFHPYTKLTDPERHQHWAAKGHHYFGQRLEGVGAIHLGRANEVVGDAQEEPPHQENTEHAAGYLRDDEGGEPVEQARALDYYGHGDNGHGPGDEERGDEYAEQDVLAREVHFGEGVGCRAQKKTWPTAMHMATTAVLKRKCPKSYWSISWTKRCQVKGSPREKGEPENIWLRGLGWPVAPAGRHDKKHAGDKQDQVAP